MDLDGTYAAVASQIILDYLDEVEESYDKGTHGTHQ
jgi:hypothetical protein